VTTDKRARLRMVITGRVQGVFFRRAAAEQARNLGITGWARNLNDGSVEIIGEGKRQHLELLLSWANHGPPHGRVDGVHFQWERSEGEFGRFEVR
jgi:acylphosphatase